MKTLSLFLVLALCAAPMWAQLKPMLPVETHPVAIGNQNAPAMAPLTDLEQAKIQIVRLTAELVQKNKRIAELEAQADTATVQSMLMDATPKRDGLTWDWTTMKFKNAAGELWDGKQFVKVTK